MAKKKLKTSQSKMSDNVSAKTDLHDSPIKLEDVLISLQKTFSRISRATSAVGPDVARAIITGQVEFELQLNISPDGRYLYSQQDGPIGIRLKGVINTDIRVVEEKTS